MSHYKSNNRDRGYSSRSGGHRGRDSRPSKMYDAVCSSCGNDCQVPFNPTGDRPVYCSNCFESNGGKSRQSSDNRSSDRRPRNHSYSGPSQQSIETLTRKIDQINAKLDDLIAAITSYEEEYDDEEEYEELEIEVEPVVDAQTETESNDTTEEVIADTDSEEPKTK